MVCLASIGKEFDAENSLRVEYWWYPGEYHEMDCILTPAFIGSRWRIRGARQHPDKQFIEPWKLAREKWA